MRKNILIVASVAAAISCQKQEMPMECVEAVNGQETVYETGNLVSSELVSRESASLALSNALATIKEESGVLHDFNLSNTDVLFNSSLLGIGMELQTYRIVYNTKGGKEGKEDVRLSADVALINTVGAAKPRCIEAINCFVTPFNTDEYSTTLFSSIVLPIRAIYNTVVVSPHFQGVYEDKGKHTVSVSEMLIKAEQAIDCEKAVIELVNSLDNVCLADNYYTENMGPSNGGATVLAMQFLLENEPVFKEVNKNLLHLGATYCCDGCYDYWQVLSSLEIKEDEAKEIKDDTISQIISVLESSSVLVPDAMLAAIMSVYDTYGDLYFKGIKAEDFFSDKYNGVRVESGGQQLSLIELFRAGDYGMLSDFIFKNGITAYNMFAEGMLKDGRLNMEDSRVMALKEALGRSERIRRDWDPKTPLTIAHSTADDFISYEPVYVMYENLSNNGRNRNVTMRTVKNMTHLPATSYFLVADILFKKHPCSLD